MKAVLKWSRIEEIVPGEVGVGSGANLRMRQQTNGGSSSLSEAEGGETTVACLYGFRGKNETPDL